MPPAVPFCTAMSETSPVDKAKTGDVLDHDLMVWLPSWAPSTFYIKLLQAYQAYRFRHKDSSRQLLSRLYETGTTTS